VSLGCEDSEIKRVSSIYDTPTAMQKGQGTVWLLEQRDDGGSRQRAHLLIQQAFPKVYSPKFYL
jgi:hypothetical protein